MEITLEKGKLKSAIVSYNTRLCLDSTNVRSLELLKIRDFLFDVYERDVVDYVTQKTDKEKDMDYFKDIHETDLNEYDEVYIYNCGLNIFGGVFKWAAIKTFKKLLDYKGKLYYILSDPKMPCQNFGEFIKAKMEKNNGIVPLAEPENPNIISYEDIDYWNETVWPSIITAFYGFDYEHFYDVYMENKRNQKVPFRLADKHDWCQFPLQEYFGSKLLKETICNYPLEDRHFDLVYFGKNRGTDRNKVIKYLYSPNELSKLFIGCEGEDFNCKENTTSIGSVKRELLFPTIAGNSFCTIIVGDQLHYDNYRTFRFFEALLLDVVAFIYIKYDSNKVLIKNDFLKDYIYISTPEEMIQKVNEVKNDPELFRKIVQLEREEVLNQFGPLSNITELKIEDSKGCNISVSTEETETTEKKDTTLPKNSSKNNDVTFHTDPSLTKMNITIEFDNMTSDIVKLLSDMVKDAFNSGVVKNYNISYGYDEPKSVHAPNKPVVRLIAEQPKHEKDSTTKSLW